MSEFKWKKKSRWKLKIASVMTFGERERERDGSWKYLVLWLFVRERDWFFIRNLNNFLEYKIEIKTKTMSFYTGLRDIF